MSEEHLQHLRDARDRAARAYEDACLADKEANTPGTRTAKAAAWKALDMAEREVATAERDAAAAAAAAARRSAVDGAQGKAKAEEDARLELTAALSKVENELKKAEAAVGHVRAFLASLDSLNADALARFLPGVEQRADLRDELRWLRQGVTAALAVPLRRVELWRVANDDPVLPFRLPDGDAAAALREGSARIWRRVGGGA